MNSRHRLPRPQDLDSDEIAAFDALAFEDTVERSETPAPGMSIGEFELERELGRGATGVVFAASQRSLDRRVAVKLTPASLLVLGPDDLERIERESMLLARVRHPSIVGIHSAGFVEGYRYVAMDLIEGSTLRHWLRESSGAVRTNLPFCIETLTHIAAGLAAAHTAKIIHRDLKPENVLLDREGRAFLADFGLARRDDNDDTVTQGFVGTPRYASPEQVRGERVGPPSDVFSFGALAYEMLTGHPAFAGATRKQTLRAIELEDPSWPRPLPASADLRAIVEHCLEKDPQRRYPTGEELLLDLERLRRFEPVQAVARGPLRRLLAQLARRRTRVAMIAMAVIAGVAILLFAQSVGESRRSLATSDLSRAQALLARGERADAIELLERWTFDDSVGRVAAGRLGDALLFAGGRSAAAPLYERALTLGSLEAADRFGDWIVKVRPNPPTTEIPTPPLTSARDHALRALALRECGDFSGASVEFDAAIDAEPATFDYRVARARVRHRLGRFEDALTDYRIAREIHPEDRSLLAPMARLLHLLSRPEEGESLLEAALEIDTRASDPELFEALGMCLIKQVRPKDALARIEPVLAQHPDHGGLERVHTIALAHSARVEDAQRIIAERLVKRPDDPHLLDASAAIALLRNDWPALEQVGRTMSERCAWPWSLEGSGHLARALVRLRRPQEAIAIYDRLLAESPFDVRWLRGRGNARVDLSQFEEALLDIDRSLEIAKGDVATLYLKARIERRTKRTREALLTYERALALDPQRGETFHWIADTWFELDNPKAGSLYAAVATQKHPNWFDAWILAALCAYHTPDMSAALAHYDRALAIKDLPQVRADRAEVLHHLGRDTEALAEYQKVREVEPTLSTTYTGEALLRLESTDPALKDVDEAIRLLERAVELEPDEAEYKECLERARKQKESRPPE